jgi:hypothetical protein
MVMILACIGNRVMASPWSTQPTVGVIGQYSSDPELLQGPGHSESNGALTLLLPVNYDEDAFHFAVTPNIRYGNASGYSSLTSNYYHLDSSVQLASELGTTTLSGALYRDSSLLYAGEIENGVGERRDTSSLDLKWDRELTERLEGEADISTTRTLYGQLSDSLFNPLVDYRYSQFSPAAVYLLTERDTLHAIGQVSRYQSLNDVSESDSYSLQAGYDRQLSEIWTLKTTVGYARAADRQNGYFIQYLSAFFYRFVYGHIDTTQNSTVYSANLSRQGEHLNLTLGASRALAPTGYSYLSRQQSVTGLATYTLSERWSFTGSVNWQTNSNPLTTGGAVQARYYGLALSTTWHWTEQWLVTLQATKVSQHYLEPYGTVSSNSVSVQIARQFLRTDL